jgi:decaprenylphospho-beta-D-erythro-pentofuranosid-2-ulose 2-reductase
MKSVVIFGGYSAIAEAVARRLIAPDIQFVLIGRNADRLSAVADDLRVRGAGGAETITADLADLDALPALVEQISSTAAPIELALLAHGTLPDQAAATADAAILRAAVEVNGMSHLLLSQLLIDRLTNQGTGTLAVITSVAGDRGRKSNYVYGAAKRLVSTYLEGLRHQCASSAVKVIDIRPGFVDTPMTAAFPKGALWSSADKVAGAILAAISADRSPAYVPRFWRLIMLIIRHLPEVIFKRMNL